jgi:ABC-2 type transport system permease protein
MLLRNVFTKTLRDLRWPTFWVALGMGGMTAYFAILFPTYSKILDIQSLMAKMGPVAKIFGASGDVNTLTGFLHIELFSMILPALLVVLMAGMGSGFTAGEESKGTIDVLLSYPISRRRLVLEKALAVFIAGVVAVAATWLSGVAGAALSSSPLAADNLAAACLMLLLLSLVYGSLALAISAATGNRGAAIGVAVGLLVVTYLIDGLATIVDGLNTIRWVSPFKYYMGNDPLRNGVNLGDAAVLAGLTVVFLAVSLVAFDRRDLAA